MAPAARQRSRSCGDGTFVPVRAIGPFSDLKPYPLTIARRHDHLRGQRLIEHGATWRELSTGLSSAEAAARLARDGLNILPKRPSVPL